MSLVLINPSLYGGLAPLINFTYNSIDQEISNSLQASLGGGRTIVRTKGIPDPIYSDQFGQVHLAGQVYGNRNMARSSTGDLYICFNSTSTTGQVYKSVDDGDTWTFVDSWVGMVGSGADTLCCAIDSNDVLHVVSWEYNTFGVRYASIDTTDDSELTPLTTLESEENGTLIGSISVCIDSDDRLHIAWVDETFGDVTNIWYINNVTGSKIAPLTSQDFGDKVSVWAVAAAFPLGLKTDITVNRQDIPQVIFTDDDDGSTIPTIVAQGNQNDATSFETFELEDDTRTFRSAPSIMVDQRGDTHCCWIDDPNRDILYRKHKLGDSWSTWQTEINIASDEDYEGFSFTEDENGNLYLIGATEAQVTKWFISTDYGLTWTIGNTDDMPNVTDEHVKARWSLYNYHFKNKLDISYYQLTDDEIYHNLLTVDHAGKWRDIDSIIGTNHENRGGGRTLVRTSKGILYTAIWAVTDDDLEVRKSTDEGITWTALDTGNEPTLDGNGVSMAIDSTDVIHIIFFEEGTGPRWVTFDTNNDTFGTPQTIASRTETFDNDERAVAICVDSNDKPHVSYYWSLGTGGGWIYYRQRVSGSWSSLISLEGHTGGFSGLDMTIDDDDIAQIVLTEGTAAVIRHYILNQNAATAIDTETIIQGLANTNASSICITQTGDTYLAYTDNGDVTFAYHIKGDSWATWTEVTVFTGTVGDTTMTLDKNDNPIILVTNSSNISFAYKSVDIQREVWTAIDTSHDSSGITDDNIIARWSFLNYYFPDQIDYTLNNSTAVDTYYNRLIQQGGDHLYVSGKSFGGTGMEIWSSLTDGNTWEEIDSTGLPTGANTDSVSCAIDSNDDIHVSWMQGGVGIRYEIFDMVTQSHGTAETAIVEVTTVDLPNTSISIDKENKPHIAFSGEFVGEDRLMYTNKISGWASEVIVKSAVGDLKSEITLNIDDIPQIVETQGTSAFVHLGNLNDATSFTEFDTITTADLEHPSMALDSLGNTHICYISGGDVIYRKHNQEDSWTTSWQPEVTVESGTFEDVSITIDERDNIVIISNSSTNVTNTWISFDGGLFFEPTNTHNTGTVVDEHIRVRWSQLNFHNPALIDYTIYDITAHDTYYNSGLVTGSGTGNPLTNFLFNMIDSEISNDLQASIGGARTLVRTKGSGTDAYLSIDTSVYGFGSIRQGARHVVRSSTGALYLFVATPSGQLLALKSVDEGGLFATVGNESGWGDQNIVACAIDSNDIIHIVGWDSGVGLKYTTHNAITDVMASDVTAIADTVDQTTEYVSITIDSNDIPHVVYTGGSSDVGYTNRIGGTWASPVGVHAGSDVSSHDCTIDENDIIQVATQQGTNISCWQGNQNDATSFTQKSLVAADSTTGIVSICIDKNGDTHVIGLGSADFIIHWKHNKNITWNGTWVQQFVTESGDPDYESVSITIDQAGDLYIFATDVTNNETTYFKSTNLGLTWDAGTTDDMAGIVDEYVKTRWSYLNYYFPNKLDYTLNEITSDDVDFNTVLVDTTEKWRDTDNQISTNGGNLGGNRTCVRTSTGVLYVIHKTAFSAKITITKSLKEGVSFTNPGFDTSPINSDTDAVAMAIDSADNIHVVRWDNGVGLRYSVYDTITDTWGTEETAQSETSAPTNPYVAITIDSNDKPHVVYADSITFEESVYTNKISGWSTKLTVNTGSTQVNSLDITIDDDDIPQIMVGEKNGGNDGIIGHLGNQNDATSFSNFTLSSGSTVEDFSGSIVVDKKGDTYISYLLAGDVKVRKHIKGVAWTTWETEVNVSTGTFEDTSMILDVYDNPIIFTNDDSNVSFAYKSIDGGATWSALDTSHDMTTAVDEHLRVRWSFLNHHFPTQFDYTTSEETAIDVYYNKMVQTGADHLYAVGRNPTDSEVEVWYSPTEGVTWEEIDPAATLWGTADTDSISCAIDSLDDIHVTWWDQGVGLRYGKFRYSSQTIFSVETAQANTDSSAIPQTAIAIDSADKPHALYVHDPSDVRLKYTNKISGWSTPIEPSSANGIHGCDILIDDDDIPQLCSVLDGGSNDVHVNLGDANDPTTFSGHLLSTPSISLERCSMAIDSLGNTHVSLVESGNIKYYKHIKTDGWTTWQTPIDVVFGTFEDTNIMVDGLNNIYIFSNNSLNITQVRVSTDGGATFGDAELHDTPTVTPFATFTDEHIRARWSYLNFHNPNKIEYTVFDSSIDEVYYNSGVFVVEE